MPETREQIRTLREQAADAINASDRAAERGDLQSALELHHIGVSLSNAAAALDRRYLRSRLAG